tara:strand:+ start:746 stop:952 length:207 start_codon:yes stop_codon:yes gene_type:complete
MKLAGKYKTDYIPEIFPNQKLMQSLAQQTNNLEFREALLNFQYPFTIDDLKNSGYSPEIVNEILKITK